MSAGGGQSSSQGSSMTDALNMAEGLSRSFNESFSRGQSETFIDPNQQNLQNNLNRQAMNSLGQDTAQVQNAANLATANNQNAQAANAALMDPKAQIAAQTASLQAGLGSLFTNEINPAIEGGSVGSGGFGGGRMGVAQGVGAGQMADAFTQGLGDITARANAQALSAAGQAGTLGQQGMGFASGVSDFLQGQLSNVSGILGMPTILSRSSDMSQAQGASRSQNKAYGESRSRASDTTDSYEFDFGWF